MAPVNAKYIDSRFEKITEENSILKKEVENLKEVVSNLKSELQGIQFVVSENIERREAVETNLATVNTNCDQLDIKATTLQNQCLALESTQTKLKTAIEIQAQYSRLTTLLFSGEAVPTFCLGEDTRAIVLNLIRDYLGITIHPLAISACHRLRNKNTVLLRFINYAERDAVYRQRTRPKKLGLSIHESLTSERLSVVRIIKDLHYPKERSPFHTHYTSQGRIFIRPRGASRAVEVGVGATREDILALCGMRSACWSQGSVAGSGLVRDGAPLRPASGSGAVSLVSQSAVLSGLAAPADAGSAPVLLSAGQPGASLTDGMAVPPNQSSARFYEREVGQGSDNLCGQPVSPGGMDTYAETHPKMLATTVDGAVSGSPPAVSCNAEGPNSSLNSEHEGVTGVMRTSVDGAPLTAAPAKPLAIGTPAKGRDPRCEDPVSPNITHSTQGEAISAVGGGPAPANPTYRAQPCIVYPDTNTQGTSQSRSRSGRPLKAPLRRSE